VERKEGGGPVTKSINWRDGLRKNLMQTNYHFKKGGTSLGGNRNSSRYNLTDTNKTGKGEENRVVLAFSRGWSPGDQIWGREVKGGIKTRATPAKKKAFSPKKNLNGVT